MSPLWSDMALARAAWAKAEEATSAGGKINPSKAGQPTDGRPARRVLHPDWLARRN
jgi:hypothetical protein